MAERIGKFISEIVVSQIVKPKPEDIKEGDQITSWTHAFPKGEFLGITKSDLIFWMQQEAISFAIWLELHPSNDPAPIAYAKFLNEGKEVSNG